MNAATTLLLIGSHVAVGSMGWLLTGAVSGDDTPEASAALPRDHATAEPGRIPGNPIIHATGADFRAAWEEMLRSASSRGGLSLGSSFFTDWCGVDPEGAILGLRNVYAPDLVNNYLSLAAMYYGAEMAEPLVKHWRELDFLPPQKLFFRIGICLEELAKEEPAKVAGLVLELPEGARQRVYGAVMDELGADELRVFVDELLARNPQLGSAGEREEFFRDFARSLHAFDAAEGFARWLPEVTSREGVSALADGYYRQVVNNQRWDEFFQSLASLDDERRGWAHERLVQGGTNFGTPGYFVPFLAACVEHDSWELAQARWEEDQMRKGTLRVVDPPEAFLDWAATLEAGADAPLEAAVGYALHSDTEGTFAWIERQPSGGARDRILLAGIERLAGDASQHGVLRDWLDLFQSPQVRREAERMLEAE